MGREENRHGSIGVRSKSASGWSGNQLVGHDPNFFFNLGRVDHHNGIPWAAVQEATIGTLAGAFLTPNAQDRVHLDSAKGWMILIGHPKHAILYRTILDAGWRSGTTRTAFRDYRQLFGFLFAYRGDPFGAGLVLEFFGHHARLFCFRFGSHILRIISWTVECGINTIGSRFIWAFLGFLRRSV